MTKSEPLPARRDDNRPLLERILSTPDLARVIPRLPPEVLHRVIEHCGLEDSGEVVALATPQQLSRVFDMDLWRPAQPGRDEDFDASRFGLWLSVLAENDPAVAAQKLAGMDAGLLITAFAQHVRVYDPAVLTIQTEDGEEIKAIDIPEDAPTCRVGGYLVVATRDDAWDAIVDVLVALESDHKNVFHRVMIGCRNLSNAPPEIDGLDDLASDAEQAMFDVAVEREERREKQGYMSPAQARAFLQAARELDVRHSTTMPEPSPVARAYFSAVDPAPSVDESGGGAEAQSETDAQPVADARQRSHCRTPRRSSRCGRRPAGAASPARPANR